MKAIRKSKLTAQEWARLKEVRYNYHKFLWTRFKRRIRIKRLNK